MIDQEHFDPVAYVAAAAPAMGFALSPDRVEQVAVAFALVVRIAGPALACPVHPESEPASVFAP